MERSVSAFFFGRNESSKNLSKKIAGERVSFWEFIRRLIMQYAACVKGIYVTCQDIIKHLESKIRQGHQRLRLLEAEANGAAVVDKHRLEWVGQGLASPESQEGQLQL